MQQPFVRLDHVADAVEHLLQPAFVAFTADAAGRPNNDDSHAMVSTLHRCLDVLHHHITLTVSGALTLYGTRSLVESSGVFSLSPINRRVMISMSLTPVHSAQQTKFGPCG